MNLDAVPGVSPDTEYPTLLGADQLHAQGIDGTGVTVAVVDTGYWSHPNLDTNSNGAARVLAQYDAIADQMDPLGTDTDTFGHGTHLTSDPLERRRRRQVQRYRPGGRPGVGEGFLQRHRLAGTAHYGGPARRDTVSGIYYHADQVGYEWDGTASRSSRVAAFHSSRVRWPLPASIGSATTRGRALPMSGLPA
ncbi:MAG: hypothetical protein GY719_01965 [bacterium]|nr:hypothetical protein [bacterium]